MPGIVRVIPAGKTVYVGNDLTGLLGRAREALRNSVAVASTPARRDGLPSVTKFMSGRPVTLPDATNPYRTAMSPNDYTASVAFDDEQGRIVGGSGATRRLQVDEHQAGRSRAGIASCASGRVEDAVPLPPA